MLKINQFYWRLYKESPEGEKAIEKFERASYEDFSIEDSVSLLKEYNPVWFLSINEIETVSYFESAYNIIGDWVLDSSMSARKNAENMIAKCFNGKYDLAIQYIAQLSFYLYKLEPSYFIPYLFLLQYNYIRRIMEDYDLDVMEVPGKANLKDRCLYYLDICDALNEFRAFNGLTGSELCAFIYDMERKRYDATYSYESTPFPQVWLIGGGKDGGEVTAKSMPWQANSETKKGDIMVMYETGETEIKEHKSCITGIWRAKTDGITDPLFLRYGSVIIGDELKIKPIPFKKLAEDSRTKHLPRCGAHFCGVRGDAVSTKQYERLLNFIEEWDTSFNRNKLPELHKPFFVEVTLDEARSKGIKPEKWVEEYLIVPMLKKMKWVYKVDYDRQVHLQMGRIKIEGEKTQDGRTDFSLFPFGRQLKCADVLIEAKGPGEMEGRDVETAFWQAESYASRQYANLIILADGDKVLLFPRKQGEPFRFSNTPEKYTWDEIFSNTNDAFTKLRTRILGYRKHGK